MCVANGIILLLQFGVVFSALSPITKCSLSDSNCIQTSAQQMSQIFIAGFPELGTETLDPMKVDAIKVDLSGLKLDIRDVIIKGLNNSVIENMSVNMEKKHMQLVFHADLTMRGKYKASGRLLILPISGDGDTVMKIKNCQIVMDMTFDTPENKDGKSVINLKGYKYRFDVRDGASYLLTNLFNGNKALSDTLHSFMNENWKTMTLEFGLPVFNKPIQKIYESMKTYLNSQPIDDITIN